MPRYELNGRTALITGGARGIGLAAAQALASRGARVAILDLDEERAAQAAAGLPEGAALGIGGDVADLDDDLRAVAQTVERFGSLDVVIANAGVVAPASTFLTTPIEAFDRVLDVDLHGVFRTVHAALPEIVRRQGHVVLISSIAAFRNGYGRISYSLSKAAVESFGHSLRTELLPHGASATVAYLGLIQTNMVTTANDGEAISAVKNRTMPKRLRRPAPVEDAAAAIVRGIAERRARVFCPRAWQLRSILRGIQVPISDARKERDPQVCQAVRELEAATRPATGPR